MTIAQHAGIAARPGRAPPSSQRSPRRCRNRQSGPGRVRDSSRIARAAQRCRTRRCNPIPPRRASRQSPRRNSATGQCWRRAARGGHAGRLRVPQPGLRSCRGSARQSGAERWVLPAAPAPETAVASRANAPARERKRAAGRCQPWQLLRRRQRRWRQGRTGSQTRPRDRAPRHRRRRNATGRPARRRRRRQPTPFCTRMPRPDRRT